MSIIVYKLVKLLCILGLGAIHTKYLPFILFCIVPLTGQSPCLVKTSFLVIAFSGQLMFFKFAIFQFLDTHSQVHPPWVYRNNASVSVSFFQFGNIDLFT